MHIYTEEAAAGPVCPGTVARAALGKGKESPTLVLEIPTSGGECKSPSLVVVVVHMWM